MLDHSSTNLAFKCSGLDLTSAILLLIVHPRHPMSFLGMITHFTVWVIRLCTNNIFQLWSRKFDTRDLILCSCFGSSKFLWIFILVPKYQMQSQVKILLERLDTLKVKMKLSVQWRCFVAKSICSSLILFIIFLLYPDIFKSFGRKLLSEIKIAVKLILILLRRVSK